jgi:putative transposase
VQLADPIRRLHAARISTELIADRVWRTRSQLELAVVEYISWYNAARLHESLSDIPPAEYEQVHADREATTLAGASV